MQIIQILVDIVSIGQRTVDVVEIRYNQLSPINEPVKLLSPVAHHLTISVIERKHHLNIGGSGTASEFRDQIVDRSHTRHEMRLDDTRLLVGTDQALLQVVGEELPTAAIREHKAIVFKSLNANIIAGYLLQKRIHRCSLLVFSCLYD